MKDSVKRRHQILLEPVTDHEEVETFQKYGELTGTLKRIWEGTLSNLPSELREEATSKDFILEEMKELRGKNDKTYHFKVKRASKKLRQKLLELDNFAILYEN